MNKGDQFEQKFVVTEEIYRGFIVLFKDENPLHVNNDFARQLGFPDKVMHGNILGGFLSFFVGECLPLKNVIIHSQEIKYVKPVYLNDPLLLRTTVSAIHESVKVVELKFQFEKAATGMVVAKGQLQIGIL